MAQINAEEQLNLKLKYSPETLVTSYQQFDFFKEINCASVTLARELAMFEVDEILKHKLPGLEVEIQGHGYLFIMHSRWKLISNFEESYDIQLKHQQLLIREDLRKLPNVITEDNFGTHMFSGFQLYTLDILNQLKDVDWIRIDTINMQSDEVYYTTDTYLKAITLLNQDVNQYQQYVTSTLEEFKTHYVAPLAHGFLGGIKQMPHMEKNDEE